MDILKPIPEHLKGTYDVVHVGLVVLVVPQDDPTSVLEAALSLLSEQCRVPALGRLS